MITANATPYPCFMYLEIIYPGRKHRECKAVKDEQEANRLIAHLNRKYIYEKLSSWLRQRRFALQQSTAIAKKPEVARLLIMLNYYEKKELQGLCKFVNEHKAIIEMVAPPPSSTFHNHYSKVIQPIIAFCNDMVTK